MTIDVFQYDDYRKYLQDWAAAKATGKRSLSMRAIARRAGFKAHNILPLVLAGKRNLTEQSAIKLAAGIGLDRQASRYFVALVRLNRADSDRARLDAYQELASFPSRQKLRPSEKPQLVFFRSWLGPVIFEMAQLPGFKPDPHWIAERLSTRAGIVEVRRVLIDLIESGAVHVAEDGTWRTSGTLLATGDGVHDFLFLNYHQQALEQAAYALERLPEEKRSYHVLTAAIPSPAFHKLKELIATFEADFWRCADTTDADADEVVQVSLQMFTCLETTRPPKVKS